MYLKSLSVELATDWFRDLLIGGWTPQLALAAIKALDDARPLRRAEMVAAWQLPMPRVAEEGRVDENGDPLLREDGGRMPKSPVLANNSGNRLMDLQRSRERKREDKAAKVAAKRLATRIEGWERFNAGLRGCLAIQDRSGRLLDAGAAGTRFARSRSRMRSKSTALKKHIDTSHIRQSATMREHGGALKMVCWLTDFSCLGGRLEYSAKASKGQSGSLLFSSQETDT